MCKNKNHFDIYTMNFKLFYRSVSNSAIALFCYLCNVVLKNQNLYKIPPQI